MPNVRKNRSRRARRTKGSTASAHSEPPRVNVTTRVRSQTFRFSAGSGLTGAAIYSTDFVGLQAVATAATTLNSLIAAVRIHKITIFSPASSTTSSNSEILWAGNQQRVQERINTASVSGAFPATVSSKPPKDSDVSKWFDGSTSAFVVCKLTVPSASIVDIKISYQLHNQIVYYSPVAYTGSSGLTTGYVYFGPLDRVSSGPGSTKLNPIGDVVFYG